LELSVIITIFHYLCIIIVIIITINAHYSTITARYKYYIPNKSCHVYCNK